MSDAPTIEQASELMSQLEIGNADLYRNAVALMSWCVREIRDGRRIASIDEDGKSIREISMPIMNAARVQRRLLVSADGMDQIVHLISNPPEPTPALRDLMARTRKMRTVASAAP